MANFFENFKKGMDKAKEDVFGNQESLSPFQKIQKEIKDTSISDARVLIEIKKFLDNALDTKEIDAVIELLIKERPKAIDFLNKK